MRSLITRPSLAGAAWLIAIHTAPCLAQPTTPDIRILSSSGATVAPSAGDKAALMRQIAADLQNAAAQAARSRASDAAEAQQQPVPAAPSRSNDRGRSQPSAAAGPVANAGTPVASAASGSPRSGQLDARARAAQRNQRLAEVRQATSPVARPRPGRTTSRAAAATAPAAAAADVQDEEAPQDASTQAQREEVLPPAVPVPLRERTTSNPLAAEVARQGNAYYFNGTLNGAHVRFRIRDGANGVAIPLRLALSAGMSVSQPTSEAGAMDVAVPARALAIGPFPVARTLVRVVSADSDVIDIGPDALSNFRFTTVNGYRLLVPSSYYQGVPDADAVADGGLPVSPASSYPNSR